jgi:myo-inositol-1(or 4)-monophosphatase
MPALPAELAVATLREARVLVEDVGRRMVAFGDSLRASRPKDGVDVVTEADAFSERELSTALARQFPHHRIAGEEGTRLGPPESDWTWWLDPLDGTGNFSRALPYWAISLGLAYREQPLLGIIHGPACGITVLGAVGLGAWSHDAPLPDARRAGEPREWMVATDWPWGLDERQRTNQLLVRLAPRIRQYKTFGSAAIDLAHLALGHVDAYCISGAFRWDLCAGAAVARALSYEVRTWDGADWDLSRSDIVACRPGMWDSLLREAVGA